MKDIYFLVLLVLTGIGSAYITTILPRLKTRVLAFINAKRNRIDRRIEQLEKRVELHTRKDGTYLDKFDSCDVKTEELEEQIKNLSARLTRRTKNDRDMIRKEVKEYLKQLQNGK